MRPISHFPQFPRHGVRALTILAALALVSLLDAASVRGRLAYFNGAPAAGIAVRLTNAKGGSPFSYSGRNGVYVLNGIPAGTYMLEVWQNRAIISRQSVTVKEPSLEAPLITLP